MTRKSTQWLAPSIARWQGVHELKEMVAQCDVVHFVGIGWNLIGFAAERAARKNRAVITCWPAVHPGECGDSQLDVSLYRNLDGVFVQSECEFDLLDSLGVPREKLIRCQLAPPDAPLGHAARFREKHRIGDRKLILFIGRKSREKGYHALRAAVAQVAASHPDVCLVSIGRALDTVDSELPSEVDLDLGVVDEETKQDALAACDLLVVPSSAESFGIVYTEAWRYGKPVICGEAPASRELINRFRGGLCSSHDVDDLVQKISHLLGDPDLRDHLGRGGRNAIDTHFSWDRVAETHAQAWQSLSCSALPAGVNHG